MIDLIDNIFETVLKVIEDYDKRGMPIEYTYGILTKLQQSYREMYRKSKEVPASNDTYTYDPNTPHTQTDSVGTVINMDTVKKGFDWLMENNDLPDSAGTEEL